MRGNHLRPVAIGVGTFLLIAGLVTHLYVYDRLAAAPADQESTTVLVGKDATVFDAAALAEMTTDLTTTVRTVGDVAETRKSSTPDGVVVWYSTSSTRSEDGTIRARSTQKTAFDARSGEAVDCCGSFLAAGDQGQEVPVARRGLVFKFPFSTEKKTYQWWDDQLADPVPMRFAGVEQVRGLRTYRFAGTVPRTRVGGRQLPARVLGLPGHGEVNADSMYVNRRVFWVEPNTGAIVDRQEAPTFTYAVDGTDQITTLQAVMRYTDHTVAENVAQYGRTGAALAVLRGWVPLAAAGLGLALILLGLLAGRWSRSAGSGEVGDDEL